MLISALISIALLIFSCFQLILGDYGQALLLAVIVLAYACCLALDCLAYFYAIKALALGVSYRLKPMHQRKSPLSSLGVDLRNFVQLQQHHRILWEQQFLSDSLTESFATSAEAQVLPVSKVSLKGEEIDHASLLKRIISTQQCQAAALVFPVTGIEEAKIFSLGVGGQRFNWQLKDHLKAFLADARSNSHYKCRPIDELENQPGLSGGFSVFGYPYYFLLPVRYQLKEGTALALLWIGFDENNFPTEQRCLQMKEVILELQRELGSGRKLAELRLQASEAVAENQAKSDFLAHMSHDIRSPLSNIKSVLYLLSMECLGQNLSELIEIALDNCAGLNDMLEDILSYSKFASGKLSASRQVCSLNSIVQSVFDSFKPGARLKGLELLLDLPRWDCQVEVDERQVRRVLSNLMSNAVKYTDIGFVKVRLQINQLSSQVTLDIMDSGPGMSEQQLRRLFEPFERLNYQKEGIGLGLALTKVLCGLNDIDLMVTSREGKGSIFTVQFALLEAAGEESYNSSLARLASSERSPFSRVT